MPIRKIEEEPTKSWFPKQACRDPEHDPPTHIVLEPGLYEHECPSCQRTVRFRIQRVICSVAHRALSASAAATLARRDSELWPLDAGR